MVTHRKPLPSHYTNSIAKSFGKKKVQQQLAFSLILMLKLWQKTANQSAKWEKEGKRTQKYDHKGKGRAIEIQWDKRILKLSFFNYSSTVCSRSAKNSQLNIPHEEHQRKDYETIIKKEIANEKPNYRLINPV